MKDEMKEVLIIEYICLRQKCSPGVNVNIFRHGMNMLRSEGLMIYGVRVNKISLSPLVSKRYIAENGIDTFASQALQASQRRPFL